MKRKWRLGERVVRRDGGAMIGKIVRITPGRAFGIWVLWPNGTRSLVAAEDIKIPLPNRLERFRDIFETGAK